MRRIHVVMLAGLAAVGLLTWNAPVTSACSGLSLTFGEAIRAADGAIYAGRVLRADDVDTFWTDFEVDINFVARGPASPHVERAQAGDPCESIRVGDYGFVVRDVRLPPRDDGDLFFAISERAGREALLAAGLPDTSTAPRREGGPAGEPWLWLGFWAVTAVALSIRRREHRA